jgi:hypothetical protein
VGQPALSYFIARSTVIRVLRPSGITRSTTGAFGSFGDLGRKRERDPLLHRQNRCGLGAGAGSRAPEPRPRRLCLQRAGGLAPKPCAARSGRACGRRVPCPSDRHRMAGTPLRLGAQPRARSRPRRDGPEHLNGRRSAADQAASRARLTDPAV